MSKSQRSQHAGLNMLWPVSAALSVAQLPSGAAADEVRLSQEVLQRCATGNKSTRRGEFCVPAKIQDLNGLLDLNIKLAEATALQFCLRLIGLQGSRKFSTGSSTAQPQLLKEYPALKVQQRPELTRPVMGVINTHMSHNTACT